MSQASAIIEYIGSIVNSHSGTILDLTDETKTAYFLNAEEQSSNIEKPFVLKDSSLPYVQIVAPIARSIKKTSDLEQLQIDVTISVFFRLPNTISHSSLEAQQYKQDAAQELRVILDQLERSQIGNASSPDFWIESSAQISIEKSTLYSEPGDLYPPWMASANFTVSFDEEYT